MGLVRPMRLVILGVIVVVAIAGFVFRDSMTGSAGDLRAGDCFDLPNGNSVTDVQHHPCTDPHTAEIVSVFDYPSPPEQWPGDAAFDALAQDKCVSGFSTYTGLDYQTASQVAVGYFYPKQENWPQDKEIDCYATPADGQPISFSYRQK